MSSLAVLLALALAAEPAPAAAPADDAAVAPVVAVEPVPAPIPWMLEFEEPGLKVYSRPHKGSGVKEVKAESEFDVPPLEARVVITDMSFSAKLPYVAEYRIITTLDERHDTLYTRLKFPIIDDRDYFIDSELVSDLAADGSGTYHKAFKLSATRRPSRSGIVRIPVCEGSWSLTASPTEGKTSATYHLLTDPGGWLPSSVTNLANRRAVPDLVRSLHGEMKRRAALRAPPLEQSKEIATSPSTPHEAAAAR